MVDSGFMFRIADFLAKGLIDSQIKQVAEIPVFYVSTEELLQKGASFLRTNPPLISVFRANPPVLIDGAINQNTIPQYYRYGSEENRKELKYRYTQYKLTYNVACVSYLQAEQNSFVMVCNNIGLNQNFPFNIVGSQKVPQVNEEYLNFFPKMFMVKLLGISQGSTSEDSQARLLETIASFEIYIALPMILKDDGDFVDSINMLLQVNGDKIVTFPINIEENI